MGLLDNNQEDNEKQNNGYENPHTYPSGTNTKGQSYSNNSSPIKHDFVNTGNSTSTSANSPTAASTSGKNAVGGATTATSGSTAAAGGTAAAPIILIIALCIGLILIFNVLLDSLTPDNATTVAAEYTKTKFESTIDNITDAISGIFNKLFGIRDEFEKIEANESQYDKNNEYDVAFIQNYNTINTALNAAYKKNVDRYLKDYCKSHKYSYKKSKQLLETKYPNGWKDIYSSVNYGEFINVLSLGYKTGAYGDGVEKGDTNALTKFLLDENNWEVFFNINIETSSTQQGNSDSSDTSPTELDNHPDNDPSLSTEISTEEQPEIEDYEETGAALSISIYPFCLSDLFNALGIRKDDEYYDGITNYEMLELMKMQTIAICETSSGNYRQIYYTLGLDKPSATWNYSFNSSTVPDLFNNTGIIPVTGDNPQIVWSYLKQSGFTDAGAAGIMGNLMTENGFRTTMSGEGGSVGLAQWTGTRKANLIALAQSMNMDVTDIQVQAKFLLYELSSSKYDVIRNATDVTLAADYTAYYYEACSRYASYEAYLNGKYAGIISWSRYTYSETFNTYIIDLKQRRDYSYIYYEQFAGTT